MSVGDEQKEDWIETAVRVARALKLNPVRVRWKLEGLRRRWRRQVGQASGKIEQVRYRHQICPSCGALASEGEQVCVRCRVDLPGRTVQIASRLSGSFSWLTATRLLTVLCVLAYGWVGLHGGGGFAALLSPTPETLMRWGANYQHLGPLLPLATTGGAWWRLATYMLLHGAIWHIAFNLLALSIVGPMCERIYGARRTLLIFWLTGVVAGVASLLFTRGVSIGASGAIMGLIGLLGAWGHRTGTTFGRHVRGQMIRWVIYVMVFGVLIGADNAAHAGGLVAGVLIGLLVDPAVLPRKALARRAWTVAGWAGLLLVLLTAAAIPLNPWLGRLVGGASWQRSADLAALFERQAQIQEQVCRLWEEEGEEQALRFYLRQLGREELSGQEEQEQELRQQLLGRCQLLRLLRQQGDPLEPTAPAEPRRPAPGGSAASVPERAPPSNVP